MRLKISHQTRYHYEAAPRYGLQQLRLTPKSRAGQTVIAWQTEVDGGRAELEFDDQHNNRVTLVSFEAGRREIVVACEGEVETEDRSGVVGAQGGFTPLWYFKRETALTKPGPNLRKLVRALGQERDQEHRQVEGEGIEIARLHALSSLIADQVCYETGRTHSATTIEDALEAGHGVCQDHAHIFVSAARLIGLPARYVSGYLMLTDRVDQDASHAWAETYVEGIGWIGFDPSNGICPDARYIRVATGLDYQDAAPISGLRYGEGDENMTVTLQVQQVQQ